MWWYEPGTKAFSMTRVGSVMPWFFGVLTIIGSFGRTTSAQPIKVLQHCVQYGGEIISSSTQYHIDPFLFAAVAAQESGGPGQNSGNNHVEILQDGTVGGGRGLFQLDTHWHAIARTPDAMVPALNADDAAKFLGNLLRKYSSVHPSDPEAYALTAYNAGAGELFKATPCGSRTTWSDGNLCYAQSVLRHREALVQLVNQSQGCR